MDTNKLLQGLQDIKAGGSGNSKSTDQNFLLGETAQNSSDLDTAVDYYTKSANMGNGEAMYRLGCIYVRSSDSKDKSHVPHDVNLGIKWFKAASNEGNTAAMKYLADIYGFGFRGIESNFGEAVYWFKNAIDHGDKEASEKLGDFYWTKSTENSNYAQDAFKYYSSLADKGDVKVMERLADCYASGKGVTRNKYKAIEWFKAAATAFQSIYAMYWLGNIYGFGIDETDRDRDYNEAIRWHEKAAKLGNFESMRSLGELYIKEDKYCGKKPDYETGAKWFKAAADKINELYPWRENEPDYMRIKSAKAYYKNGNYTEAFEQYKKVAKHGNCDAYFELARMYRYGEGTDKDLREAICCYSKAERGHDGALDEMKDMINGLNKSRKKELLNWAEGIYNRGGFGFGGEVVIEILRKEANSGCFITTAVCKNFDKPDDCYELMTFRDFRDTWLASQPDGKELIAEYYAVAPKIVEQINSRSDAAQIYEHIWKKYLSHCLHFIENSDNLACKNLYVEMVTLLKKLTGKYFYS